MYDKEEAKSAFKIIITILFAIFSILCIGLLVNKNNLTAGIQIFLGTQAFIYEVISCIIYFNK